MPDRQVLMLIDGHALAFRAFHALSDAGLRSSRGEPTYAVFGFVSIMLNAIDAHRPQYLAVAFDVGRTFRDEMYAEYKAGRAETPAEFEPQLARIKELLRAFNIPVFTCEGFEADDVIGTIARQATGQGLDTLILTGDTDTLQLVDEHVRVVLANPFGQKMSTKVYDVDSVLERYKGLRPDQLADLRGLKGDASDNIPGVKGIGEAGAIALLTQFGTVEKIYEQMGEVPNRYKKPLDGQRDAAVFSKDLATIRRDAPVEFDLPAARLHDYDRAHVIALFQELEFGASLVKRLPAVGDAFALADLPAAAPASGPRQADMFAPAEDAAPAVRADGSPLQLDMFGGAPAAAQAAPPPNDGFGDYVAVTTADGLAGVVQELAAAPAFAFDTETSSEFPLRAEMVGVSLAVRPGQAWYIPLRHSEGEQLGVEEVLAALRPFFADERLPKYAHNAKFDVEVLERAGVPVNGVTFDTMLAAALLDKRRGLKDLAFYERVAPTPPTPIEELIGKRGKGQITFGQVPIERATPYAAADSDLTLRLVQSLEPQLRPLERVERIFRELEMPLLPVLVRMEQAGIKLDVAYMRALGERMARQLGDLEQQIYSIAERPFNINSGDQLSDVLFGPKVDLPTAGLDRTKTGRYSLTAQVLEDLRAHDTSGIVELILRHRRLSKLKSTYVDELPDLVHPETGRVHTEYSQLGAATGRLASQNPNLMNIPTRTDEGREVRRGFIAEPGCVLIGADYSQIELRVLAHITEDENLVRAFKEGYDIHAATAAQLFGIPVEKVDKNQRRVAKTVVFGVIYGISAFGLAPRIGASREEARRLIDGLFERYPAVRTYIDQTIEAGKRDGFVQSLFGRRRMMPDLRNNMAQRRQAAEREAINAPIQATAADLIKLAMTRIDRALREGGFATRMLLQVHDELIFEAPEAEVARVAALIRQEMEHVYELKVPLEVGVESGVTWDDMQPLA